MTRIIEIHPDNPQPRLIKQVVEVIHQGGVVAYPTDSSYAIGCHIGDKQAMDRIRRIRRVDSDHNFTLVCPNLADLSLYAKVDNASFRLMKRVMPGPYTLILKASREVPRRLQHPKKKTIGLRVPDHAVAHALMETLGEPLMSSTLIPPGETIPLNDPFEIEQQMGHALDLIVDGGHCGVEATTVVDMIDGLPKVVRVGCGDPSPFE
ncbi:MAG: threonylcarbamoyl-AMP synthase [Gammaproteobacteria bacterium]|nr:threonylcarbamoyl-AMP synthase [Gammaproteobacteria bacterium]MBT3490063.1 threonylcarbamoyl-AMP synthase [Gammaproteobacteria bacterium]MBT3719485.1 threonylcarbamoyl-AMP synthase [Gammaproteobacteria bacterium]MBT3843997.1 threonylcarbamoyl-AMP synthase [Gammaproteobacteria bacterium]MBT3892944.1 threonylcarbamoyl-AMP synthase [Gammaproteobacteria bacterium]